MSETEPYNPNLGPPEPARPEPSPEGIAPSVAPTAAVQAAPTTSPKPQSTSAEQKSESTDTKPKKSPSWPKVAFQLKVALIVFLISTGLDLLVEFFFPGSRDGIWSFNQSIIESVSSLQPLHLMTTFYGHMRDLILGPIPDRYQWSSGIGWIFLSIAFSIEYMFEQSFSHGIVGFLIDLAFLAWAAYILLGDREPDRNYVVMILLWPVWASFLALFVEVPIVIAGLLVGSILHGIQAAAVLGMGSIPITGLVAPARSIAEHHMVEGALKRMEKAEEHVAEHAAEKTPPA